MEINLVMVSKLTSDVLNTDIIKVESLSPQLSDLMNNIYDKYQELWHSEKYKLYWQYNKDTFFQIKDYISYLTAIRLIVNNTIYLLIDDYFDYWEDNVSFLAEMDRIDEEKTQERERNIYDVKIKKTESVNNEVVEDKGDESTTKKYSDVTVERTPRTDSEIISYAIRKIPHSGIYTADLIQKFNLLEDLKKGFPKFRTELQPMPNFVFEKRIYKPPKGQKEKNGKNKKREKEQKNKKDKKEKNKGGKKK